MSPKSPLKTRVVRRSVAMLLGLVLSVLAAEVAIRTFAPQEASWLDIYREDERLGAYSLLPDLASTIETGEGRWHVFTDHRGRRVKEGNPEPEAAPWLLVLGDSFAFGFGVEYEASFVGLLGERLEPACSVVDTGVPGYGPIQYRQVLEEYLAAGEQPAAVLLVIFVGNDFMDCVWNKRLRVIDGALDSGEVHWRIWLKRNSQTYRLLSKIYQRRTAKSSSPMNSDGALYHPEAWDSGELARAYGIFESEIRRIAELCNAHRISLAAVVIPTNATLNAATLATAEPSTDYALPVQRAAIALRTSGIPFEELSPALRMLGSESSFFAHNGHLTPKANAAAVDAIWPLVQRALSPRDR